MNLGLQKFPAKPLSSVVIHAIPKICHTGDVYGIPQQV